MKKAFVLVCVAGLMALAQITQAQIDLKGSTYNKTIDTVDNTETLYLTTPSLAQQNSGKYVIQLDATNKTGTTTITAVLESSLDNVTFSNHFKTPGQTGVNCDTLAISGTKQHIWNILPGAVATYNLGQYQSNSGRRLFFRIKLTGGATGTTQVKAKEIPQ